MREALVGFLGLERRAMPGTLHQLQAHIKRAAAAARRWPFRFGGRG
jgi:hypothetical protein